jgi:hypothetical protein
VTEEAVLVPCVRKFAVHLGFYKCGATFRIHCTSIIGRLRRRWEDNIKMGLQEVGRGRGDWMELAQDRDRWRALVGTVRKFRVPKMRGIS